mgnify:CR=1 FL=1
MTEVINEMPPVENAGEGQKELNPFFKALRTFCGWFGFGIFGATSNKRRRKVFYDVITYIILVFFAFIMIYPFWWMIAASFARNRASMLDTVWWPSELATENRGGTFFYHYTNIMRIMENNNFDYWRVVLNTLIYSIVPVVIGLITSTMAAFAFAKLNFKGKNFVFFYCLAAIMVPGPSIMIAQFCVYSELNWTMNGLSMIIPGCFGAIMTAFFIRQFLFSMPTSIIEAAKIDGAGYWRIFWGFVMPLAMPAVMAQGILSFIGCWNNYLGPLIFVRSSEWYPLALVVSQLNTEIGTNVDSAPSVMALAVLALLPVLVLFAVFQKTIIGSIMLTGSKE